MANVLLVFLICLGLAGCASPSLPMLDAPVTRLSVDGAAFTVRHNAWRAEAVRTSAAAGATVSTTNVWAVEIRPGQAFVYELGRPNRLFRVEFDLTRPVAE